VIFVEGSQLPMSLSIARPASGGARFTPDATMRIASNTKTFVAVAALKLVEQGQLDLDAPISQTLPLHLQTLLSDGGYDVDAITARMLLQHTSGLADHAQLQVYFDQVMADPQRLWSREDQVSLAMSEGEAAGAPGERFAYSDTGYVLLGAIIENVHGAPMADAIRELSGIDQLGLRATWWEAFEPEPEGAPARFPQVAFGLPLSDINPSVDLYGGGGLISNLDDLAQYHHAAASGALFEDATLNAALISPSPQSQANGQGGYGMGFFIREYAGETCYEHSGFWGTLAVYCPETDITVAAAVTDAEAGFAALWPMVEAIVIAAR
jgi:D-alanyl-D-alanine carboxypeptidase